MKADQTTGEDVLCVLIHGDAAFAGQGINQEALVISYLPHYHVGGSLHLIVNNQVRKNPTQGHCNDFRLMGL